MKEEIKRLFFGVEIHAPWPSTLPSGRLLDEKHRHLTLAFLGNIPYAPLYHLLNHFPKLSLRLGVGGYFDDCLTLPPRHPHVVAWHAQELDNQSSLSAVQHSVSAWLISHDYSLDTRPWKPHVTLSRQPFDAHEWKKVFRPLPFYTGGIHLYESIGHLEYVPVWSYPIKSPFEEINHTADMAFIIWGETMQQLYHNAFIALAFKVPEIVNFFIAGNPLETLDDVIISLNRIVSDTDSQVGCSVKAVSFHGAIVHLQEGLLQWEMIVDV